MCLLAAIAIYTAIIKEISRDATKITDPQFTQFIPEMHAMLASTSLQLREVVLKVQIELLKIAEQRKGIGNVYDGAGTEASDPCNVWRGVVAYGKHLR